MNVQSVGGNESWADFVKLVQEARARSQGIGGGIAKNGGVRSGAHLSSAARVSNQYGIMKNEPVLARNDVSTLRTKISGSFFDAYA
jgi:hypothetical protein